MKNLKLVILSNAKHLILAFSPILFSVFCMLSSAVASTTDLLNNPEIFVGRYRLTKSLAGMCDDGVTATKRESASGAVDILMSFENFEKIGRGPQTIEDEMVAITTEAKMPNASTLENRQLIFMKTSGNRDRRFTRVRLTGAMLHMKSVNTLNSPGEEPIQFTTECAFTRVSTPDDSN